MTKLFNMRKNSGQSMVELILVIMLMAVALTAGAMMVARSMQLSEVSLNRQRAVTITKTVSEYIKKEKELNNWNVFINRMEEVDFLDGINITGLSYSEDVEGEFRIVNFNFVEDVSDPVNVEVNFGVEWEDIKGSHTIDETLTLYKN